LLAIITLATIAISLLITVWPLIAVGLLALIRLAVLVVVMMAVARFGGAGDCHYGRRSGAGDEETLLEHRNTPRFKTDDTRRGREGR